MRVGVRERPREGRRADRERQTEGEVYLDEGGGGWRVLLQGVDLKASGDELILHGQLELTVEVCIRPFLQHAKRYGVRASHSAAGGQTQTSAKTLKNSLHQTRIL